jgi:hypothetical protein
MQPDALQALMTFLSETAPDCLNNPPAPVEPAFQRDVMFSLLKLLWTDDFPAIAAQPYNPAFEREADIVLRTLIRGSDERVGVSPAAARVLLERILQAIAALAANVEAGGGTISMPSGLSASALTGAVALWWLDSMELPFPPTDRSKYPLPTVN